MSYEQLAQHAKDITDKAVNREIEEWQEENAGSGPHGPAPGAPPTDEFKKKYEFVAPLFEPFTRLPDPSKYDQLITDLRNAMGDLSNGQQTTDPINKQPIAGNPKLDKMTTAGGYLDDWTGTAAINFKANFIDPFKTISTNQFILLSTMKGALEAHQAMWRAARKDIDDIAHKTMDALDNAGGCGKNQWSFGFSVLSAVAAIAGVVVTAATGGAGAAVVVGAVGAAASTGSAGVGAINASGDSAETIVDSMKQAINALERHIDEVEQKISKAVDDMANTLQDHQSLFLSARPELAGLSGGDLTSHSGVGDPK